MNLIFASETDVLGELLDIKLDQVKAELYEMGGASLRKALTWQKVLEASQNSGDPGLADWATYDIGSIIWTILRRCRENGAIHLGCDGDITFKTRYGTFGVTIGANYVRVSADGWRLYMLLSAFASMAPEDLVAAQHHNLPLELATPRPAKQLLKELDALYMGVNNELIEMRLCEVAKPGAPWPEHTRYSEVYFWEKQVLSGAGWAREEEDTVDFIREAKGGQNGN